jgi:hypothetical protein
MASTTSLDFKAEPMSGDDGSLALVGGLVGAIIALLCIVFAIAAVIIVSRRRRGGMSDGGVSSDHDGMASAMSSDYAVVPPIQRPADYTDLNLTPEKPDYVEMQVRPDGNYSTGAIKTIRRI